MNFENKNLHFMVWLMQGCGLLAACFGFAALLGWAINLPALTTFGSGKIPMAPSTALLFLLYGLGIFLHESPYYNDAVKRILKVIVWVCLVAALGLLFLSLFHITLEAEHLGFRISGNLNGIPLGHMSPLTAGCFGLVGISFFLLLYHAEHRPWRISAALVSVYIVLLIAMVLTTAYLFGGRLLYKSGIIPPALTTSLSFISLGAGLMIYSGQKILQHDLFSKAPGRSSNKFLVLIFILFATGIVTGGYFSFRNYEETYQKAVEDQLTIIIDQKISELVQWRKERLGDASIFYKNDVFSNLVKQFIKDRKDVYAGMSLKTWLEKVQSSYAYDRILLLDEQGGLLLSVPESNEPVDSHLVHDASGITVSKKVAFLDFHRDETDPPIHLAMAVPILDEQAWETPLAVLVLRIDPETYLYPLIKRWPTTSKTAETLLVRKEGDEVLFLNELRFNKDSVLNLRFPLNRLEIPAVQAVLGKSGIVEGKDYRGASVIAGVRAVPDSPWFIVARIDKEEVFSSLKERMWVMIALTGILLAGVGTGIAFIGRQQRLQIYMERCNASEAARAAEIRYRETLDKLMEGCQIIGFDWRYLYVNDSAARHGKLAREDLLGHTMMEQYPGMEDTEMFALLKRCMENRVSYTMENEFYYTDGSNAFFQLSMQPVPEGIFVLSMDITKRKQAEDALRESERRLSSIFDAVGDVIYCLAIEADNRYRFISVNHAFYKVTGLQEEMVVGKLVNEVIPEPAHSIALEKYREAIIKNSIIRWEETSDYPTGQLVGDVSIAPVVDDKGRCIYLVGSVHDITERKRAEEREKHLNAILKAIRNVNQLITKEKDRDRLIRMACDDLVATRGFRSAWICLMDHSGKPVLISHASLEGSSFPLQEMLDKGALPSCASRALSTPGIIVIKNSDDRCPECPAASGCKKDTAFCIRLEKEGRIYGVLQARVPYTFSNDIHEQSLFKELGEDIAFALYNIELEERRGKMEKELRDSEARYRTLFESAAEGIFLTEMKTKKLKYVNPAFCLMMGYSEDEIKGLRVDDIHTKVVLKQVESEYEANYRIGKSFKQQDIAFLKKDGAVLYANVVTTPKIFIDGASFSATFVTDVTARKKSEEEKKNVEEQLWQSQKMEAIGRLSGGVAHDFNNMLTTIIGNSEIALMRLKKTRDGEEMKDLIEDIRLAGEKAAILTRQLLAFSRKQIMRPEIFSLNGIVSEMDKMLRRLIGEDIELETKLFQDAGLVEADPGQIEQIIMNLAVNARDAMPDGGSLTIETASIALNEEYAATHFPVIPGQYEMVSISDTGIGMPKELQEQIFEPFFTTKPKGKGTGLGLSIVYGIVKQSKGYVWVYSEPGNGTTFKIYLPRIETPDESLEEPIKKTLELAGGCETILVVEDDAMIMKMVTKVLYKSGYDVLRATNGVNALCISEQHQGPINMVLTDVIMPGMGGSELAKRISETRPGVKVLFMSGYTDHAIVHHGVLEKGLNFIQKPFTSFNLMKKIRDVLGEGN